MRSPSPLITGVHLGNGGSRMQMSSFDPIKRKETLVLISLPHCQPRPQHLLS